MDGMETGPTPPLTPYPVTADGITLEVLALPGGDTPRAPLVFLHEGLGSVRMWGAGQAYWPAQLCAATGRAGWVYSRQGYGESSPIPDVRGSGRHGPDYMHQEAWQRLPALLQTLGIERPVLIGHSDGATIALLHAAQHPVAGCVAMAPHVWVEAMALQAIARARTAYETEGLRARLARYHRDVDNAFWQWNDVWLSAAFRAFDIRETCRTIQAPLMLVQGLDDAYGTLAQLDAIEAACPQAQRLELADCGHSPHRDQPQRLTDALTEWLRPLP
jgi:pimeloyl-ACP methyl ester carboxylesterase